MYLYPCLNTFNKRPRRFYDKVGVCIQNDKMIVR